MADTIPPEEVALPLQAPAASLRPRRLALPRGLALGIAAAPVAAAAWVGWQGDWSDETDIAEPLEVVSVGRQEVWLVPSTEAGEDVRILSDDNPGNDSPGLDRGDAWTAMVLGRHPGAPDDKVEWGAVLLDDEAGAREATNLVIYVVSAPTVDQLRIRVDGSTRTIRSHRVDEGSYAIFDVPMRASALSVTPLAQGAVVPGARLELDVPRP